MTIHYMYSKVRLAVACVVFSAFCLAASAAFGQRALSAGADLGMGAIGDVAHATVESGVEVREGGLTVGVFGRVRLPMAGDERVRQRDWDEASDYAHLLRRFDYRRRFDQISVQFLAGELHGVTLGHGTLIRDYSNIADPDHPHPGARLELSHPRFDISLMVDNFVRPSVVAGRAAVRPVAALEALSAAASVVIDPRAPRQVALDSQAQRRVDRAYNLVTDDGVLGLVGVDLEYRIGRQGQGTITPYADFNTALYDVDGLGGGLGVHAGLSGKLPLKWRRLSLSGQLEYHFSSAGYTPAWVQTFHDLDRYQASLAFDDPARVGAADQATKLSAAANGDGGHGFVAQVALEAGRLVRLKVGFGRQGGPDSNRLWFRLSSSPVRRLTLGSLLVMRGLGEGGAGAGVAAVAEARVRLTDYLYALGQYSRIWALDDGSRYYRILQSFNLAIGSSWSG